jgi:hypothetical protein
MKKPLRNSWKKFLKRQVSHAVIFIEQISVFTFQKGLKINIAFLGDFPRIS